ncbi:MAG: HAD family phosphatase [Clostridia bacterium]|nr:HAD family phosphatase [Clostridia bacterium]
MKLRGVLFDFNGTLYFDSRMDISALNLVFGEYGAPKREVSYIVSEIFGRDNATVFRQNVKADATAEEISVFSRRKDKIYRDVCLTDANASSLTLGACEMLDELKARGIPYCLATGSSRENIEFFMTHLGLDRWFDLDRNVVHADKSFPSKPAPDIYRIAAQRIGLSPEECLVFEDGRSGIISANLAGAGAVILVHEEGYPSPLDKDTKINGEFYDFSSWKAILGEYGIL